MTTPNNKINDLSENNPVGDVSEVSALDGSEAGNTKKNPNDFIADSVRRFTKGVQLPFYAALGLTDSVASKVEDVLVNTRDELSSSNRSFTQRITDKVQSEREKLKENASQWDAHKLAETQTENVEVLVKELSSSAQNLVKGLISRGRRVTRTMQDENK